MEQFIGRWDAGFQHGYTKVFYNNGEVIDGLFENGHKRWDISEIESYDPKNDKIAQSIDVDKYLIKEDFGPAPRKPLRTFPEPRKQKDGPDA